MEVFPVELNTFHVCLWNTEVRWVVSMMASEGLGLWSITEIQVIRPWHRTHCKEEQMHVRAHKSIHYMH